MTAQATKKPKARIRSERKPPMQSVMKALRMAPAIGAVIEIIPKSMKASFYGTLKALMKYVVAQY